MLLCLPAVSLAHQQQQPLTQKQLAEVFATGTPEEKDRALADVLAIPPKQREPVLEDSLIGELQRLNAERRKRFESLRTGQPVQPEAEGPAAYRSVLTRIVGQSPNETVIPALVGALGTGPDPIESLARFGEKAVVPVSAAAVGTHPDLHVPSDAMRVLQRMLESGATLSKKSSDQILAIAAKRMTGTQYYLHVVAGIDLAIATNDLTLRQRVDQLSTDRTALRQMGISDARQEQYVRDAAFAALRR